MRKFQTGNNAQRLNKVLDDVSVLKTQPKPNQYNQTFGVVRCFYLTDTSTSPMVATGMKWDEDTAAWVESGLGTAVDVYPNPNFTNSDYQDDMYVFARNFGGRWISIDPATGGSGGIRKAYCKAAAGAATTITCYLDTDATGEEVTVNCSVVGSANLNAAVPRLEDGSLIFVWNDAGTWRCTQTFIKSQDCS